MQHLVDAEAEVDECRDEGYTGPVEARIRRAHDEHERGVLDEHTMVREQRVRGPTPSPSVPRQHRNIESGKGHPSGAGAAERGHQQQVHRNRADQERCEGDS